MGSAGRTHGSLSRTTLSVSIVLVLIALGAVAVASATSSSNTPADDLRAAASALPSEKAAGFLQDMPSVDPSVYASEKAAYLADPSPAPGEDWTPGPGDQYVSSGVLNTGEGPFSNETYNMQNAWAGLVDGKFYTVWAGAYTADATGVVIVGYSQGTPNPSSTPGDLQPYPAPSGAGSLKIEGGAGPEDLILSSASGTEYDFNVVDDSFGVASTPTSSPTG